MCVPLAVCFPSLGRAGVGHTFARQGLELLRSYPARPVWSPHYAPGVVSKDRPLLVSSLVWLGMCFAPQFVGMDLENNLPRILHLVASGPKSKTYMLESRIC